MKIISCRKIEDCFDGSAVFNYEVSESWTADNVRCLGVLGELELFLDFPRPLFRLKTAEGLFFSCVANSATCRVVLPHTNREKVRKKIEEAFNDEKGVISRSQCDQ